MMQFRRVVTGPEGEQIGTVLKAGSGYAAWAEGCRIREDSGKPIMFDSTAEAIKAIEDEYLRSRGGEIVRSQPVEAPSRRVNAYGIFKHGRLEADSIRRDRLTCATDWKERRGWKGKWEELAKADKLVMRRLQVLVFEPVSPRHGRTGTKRVVRPDGTVTWEKE